MKLGANSSYKPPGVSCTAPGPYILQGNEKAKAINCYKKYDISIYFLLKGPVELCIPFLNLLIRFNNFVKTKFDIF